MRGMTRQERTWWYQFSNVWWAIGIVEGTPWVREQLVKQGRLITPQHTASIKRIMEEL